MAQSVIDGAIGEVLTWPGCQQIDDPVLTGRQIEVRAVPEATRVLKDELAAAQSFPSATCWLSWANAAASFSAFAIEAAPLGPSTTPALQFASFISDAEPLMKRIGALVPRVEKWAIASKLDMSNMLWSRTTMSTSRSSPERPRSEAVSIIWMAKPKSSSCSRSFRFTFVRMRIDFALRESGCATTADKVTTLSWIVGWNSFNFGGTAATATAA